MLDSIVVEVVEDGTRDIPRFAIYARYSNILQRPRSIDDQILVCRRKIQAGGGTVTAIYSDGAISGASVHKRDGLQKLMADAKNGCFDAIYSEALDRLSRDQADTATIYKRLRYYGVKLITLEDGEINAMHVGFKGLMNETFLAALAMKTRRGMEGQVREGRSAGGLSYGYRVANRIASDGEVIRGLREIVPEQADTIRRIFHLYADGMSTRGIAALLNKEGVPAPRGGAWASVTINGHRQRRNGILCNELYRGRLIFGRQRAVRDPETGQRRSQATPLEQWVVQEVPKLKIIEDDLWDRVQLRRQAGHDRRTGGGNSAPLPLSDRLRCSVCAGKMTIHSRHRYRCRTRLETGTCDNNRGINAKDVEERTVASLIQWVETQPDWAAVLNAAIRNAVARRTALQRGIDDNNQRIQHLLSAIELGGEARHTQQRIIQLEHRAASMVLQLKSLPRISSRPPRNLAGRLRTRLKDLAQRIATGADQSRHAALLDLRSLITRIEVVPGPGKRQVELRVDPCREALIAMALHKEEREAKTGRRRPRRADADF